MHSLLAISSRNLRTLVSLLAVCGACGGEQSSEEPLEIAPDARVTLTHASCGAPVNECMGYEQHTVDFAAATFTSRTCVEHGEAPVTYTTSTRELGQAELSRARTVLESARHEPARSENWDGQVTLLEVTDAAGERTLYRAGPCSPASYQRIARGLEPIQTLFTELAAVPRR